MNLPSQGAAQGVNPNNHSAQKVLSSSQGHIQYINNIRAVACFLVILAHSAMPALDPSFGVIMVFFSTLGLPSSELFVTISSSLLAPTRQSMFEFYRKRFSKLVWPFLFWSVLIVILDVYFGRLDYGSAVKILLLFPIAPVDGVYWFVYVICGLYLVIPLISPWLQSATKGELLLLLALWGFTLVLPYINIISGKPLYDIRGSYYFILSYVGGFIGYLLLGVYLRRYPIIIRSKLRALVCVALMLVAGCLPLAYGYAADRSALPTLTDNLSVTAALFVLAVFVTLQNFRVPRLLEVFFNVVAKYSFGIYLIHIIVVRDVLKRSLEDNRMASPLWETPFIAITSLILCLFIVKGLSYLPRSRYIIGV